MRILSVDPSFSSSGVAYLDTELKKIELSRLEGTMGKSYEEIYFEVIDRCKRLSCLIRQYEVEWYHQEEPMVGGQSSAGLFALDTALLYTAMLCKVPKVTTSHVSHLKHLHGGKYTKTDSVNLAKKFVEVFTSNSYSFNKTRFNNDEAEAFIYLCRLYVSTNKDNLSNNLIKICPNLSNEKEKQLYPRLKQ